MSKILNPATGKFQGKRESVTVWLLPDDDDRVQMFWCPYCRNPITQYQHGKIEKIIPGKSPEIKSPVIQIMCRNPKCRKVFHFAGIVQDT